MTLKVKVTQIMTVKQKWNIDMIVLNGCLDASTVIKLHEDFPGFNHGILVCKTYTVHAIFVLYCYY